MTNEKFKLHRVGDDAVIEKLDILKLWHLMENIIGSTASDDPNNEKLIEEIDDACEKVIEEINGK